MHNWDAGSNLPLPPGIGSTPPVAPVIQEIFLIYHSHIARYVLITTVTTDKLGLKTSF